jgi:hypothetical protein
MKFINIQNQIRIGTQTLNINNFNNRVLIIIIIIIAIINWYKAKA